MSSYDIAAAATLAGLNSILAGLYALPAARQGLFNQTFTKTVDDLGSVTATYDVKAVPTVVLATPDAQQWQAASKRTPSAPCPATNVFQLVLSDIACSATVAGATVAGEGPATIYADISLDNGVAKLTADAVLIDDKNFSVFDKALMEGVLIPMVLGFADDLLKAYPLPQLPSIGGLTFQPPVLSIQPEGVVLGTSLTGGGTTDLSGFTWPGSSSPLFAVTRLNPINQYFAANVAGTHQAEDSTGSAFKCSGKVTAENLVVVAAISSSALVCNVSGKFSAYGELSGTGTAIAKTALCPVGTAVDAMSNPSDWDKVVSTVDLSYSPSPMPVPLAFQVAAPAGTPLTQTVTASVASDKLPDSIKVVCRPTWSGSVTGSALSAAASAFADLVFAVFSKIIVKDILEKYGQTSFALPSTEMTKTIPLPGGGSVTAALEADVGEALTPFGTDQLLQALVIKLS